MSEPEYLIDSVYRQTFTLKPNDIGLRRTLESARRFILDDGMAAFLMRLSYESFEGRERKSKRAETAISKSHRQRMYQLLDDMRHFSRLPHRITWVEMSAHALMQGEADVRQELFGGTGLEDYEDMAELTKGRRLGWLFAQHDKIETAFSCTTFANDSEHGPVRHRFSTPAWDTEDNPLPWHMIQPAASSAYKTGSELGTGAPGYVRANVGFLASAPWPTKKPAALRQLSQVQRDMEECEAVLRTHWVFLSTINKIPLTKESDVRVSRGFLAQRKYQTYLAHKMITLKVPQKQRRRLALKVLGAISQRRAHMVRGHWADNWRKPKGNKEIWRSEHQRGDDRIGFVTHDYNVEHDQE